MKEPMKSKKVVDKQLKKPKRNKRGWIRDPNWVIKNTPQTERLTAELVASIKEQEEADRRGSYDNRPLVGPQLDVPRLYD